MKNQILYSNFDDNRHFLVQDKENDFIYRRSRENVFCMELRIDGDALVLVDAVCVMTGRELYGLTTKEWSDITYRVAL